MKFKIGYIINDEHELLDNNIPCSINLPVLIVGYEEALKYNNISLNNWQINDNIYWIFNKQESEEKYFEGINKFLQLCFASIIKGAIIKKILSPEQLILNENEPVFVNKYNNTVTISQNNIVYYYNDEILKFFNINTSLFNIKLKKQKNVFYWDRLNYFPAVLKHNLIQETKETFVNKLKIFSDYEFYSGYLALMWLKSFNYNDPIIKIWQKAFYVEDYLSNCKVKVNCNLNFPICEVVRKYKVGDYIIQKYKGTDKVTGRMFVTNSNFSLQTLNNKYKQLVIAEENSFLLEADYNFFEFALLIHICELPIFTDPHDYMSNLLFNSSKFRKIAKTINYAILYGKSIDKIYKELKEEYKELKINLEELKNKLNFLTKACDKLNNKLIKEYEQNGYIVNLFGRKIVPNKSYALVNNYISSSAADYFINKLTYLIFLLQGKKSKILLQNHDSILFNIHNEENNLINEIQTILSEPIKNIKVDIELKKGLNWGELKAL